MAQKLYKEIYNLIKQKERILVMPSTPPDGDGLGSALALYLVLKKLGKEVTVVCADPVPDALLFMPRANVVSNQFAAANDFIVTLDCSRVTIESIKAKIENDKVNIIISPKDGSLSAKGVSFSHGACDYDLIIIVDTGDLQQLGKFYEDNTSLFTQLPVVNIDHHTSNSMFGRINLVDIMAPSASEIVTKLIESFPKGNELIDEDVATLLLAGVITDTNSFQNSNTTPRAFAAASHLLGYGARQQEIIQNVYKTKNLSTLKLWGRVLTKLRTDEKYKIVWSTITQKDLEDTHSHLDETGDIIDELMTNAPGAEIVMLIKEKAPDLVSVSVRTTHAGVDASDLAERFGGGGHVQAAGFRLKGENVEAAEKEVIEKVREFQKERLYVPEDEEEAATLEAGAAMTRADVTKAETKTAEIEVPVVETPEIVSTDSGQQPVETVVQAPMAPELAPVMQTPLAEAPASTPEATMSDSMLMKTAEDQQLAQQIMQDSPLQMPKPAPAISDAANIQPGVEFDLEPNKMFKIDESQA